MFQVAEDYPGDAAAGCDWITRAAKRELVTGGRRRGERVIVTPAEVPYEGRLCISETTVRHMAHLLGMYDVDQVDELLVLLRSAQAESVRLSTLNATLLHQLEAARAEPLQVVTVYVANDGSEHTSKQALLDYLLAKRGKTRSAARPEPMTADQAPDPSEVPA